MGCGAPWRWGLVWFLTLFAGNASFLLQFQAMQVEGVTVVSKRHPGPVSQGVRTLARVGPLVHQRVIFKEKAVVGTFIWALINQQVRIYCFQIQIPLISQMAASSLASQGVTLHCPEVVM